MDGSPSSVLTMGLGSWGSVGLVLTSGLGLGAQGQPKYPGAGEFSRMGLTGEFVYAVMGGRLSRSGMTGDFERRQ